MVSACYVSRYARDTPNTLALRLCGAVSALLRVVFSEMLMKLEGHFNEIAIFRERLAILRPKEARYG